MTAPVPAITRNWHCGSCNVEWRTTTWTQVSACWACGQPGSVGTHPNLGPLLSISAMTHRGSDGDTVTGWPVTA